MSHQPAIVDVQKLMEDRDHFLKRSLYLARQVAAWQARHAQLRHENNKLRRRNERLTEKAAEQ